MLYRLINIITCLESASPDIDWHANLDSHFVDDLGFDSLDLAELIMAVETEFDIHIPDDDVETLTTLREALNYLKANT